MPELSRVVRVIVNPPGSGGASGGVNGHGGVPAMSGLGRFYEVEVVCSGDPDPVTGYLINIKDIDHAVRDHVAPILAEACAERASEHPARLLGALLDGAVRGLEVGVRRLGLWLTPYYSVEMKADERTSVVMRQRFEFSASHRLHCDSLSDEENRRIFGKCNNPSGHGHNYELETRVAVPTDDPTAADVIERIVDETIVERYDHKHLNVDAEEFRDRNPSVELIAEVVFGLLGEAISGGGAGELVGVTVWETPRTSASYPG